MSAHLHSGNLIRGLEKMVDQSLKLSPGIVPDASLLQGLDPAIYLMNVRTYLASTPMSKGEEQAYQIAGELMECLFDPKREVPKFPICFCCGQMYVWAMTDYFWNYMRKNFICGVCDGEDYSS